MKEKKILDIVAAIGATQDINEVRRIFLEMTRNLVWFDTANFWLYPPLARQLDQVLLAMGSPQKLASVYFEYYANKDEVRQAYNRANLLIARSTDLLDYGRWTQRSEYYNDFLRLAKVHYAVGFDIKDQQISYGAVCLHREKRCGNFSRDEITLLQVIYPHLVNRLRWHHHQQVLLNKLQAYSKDNDLPEIDRFRILTPRERVIIQQVLSGYSNQDIAVHLGISINTVKMHLKNTFVKLGIKRRSQLFLLLSD